MIYLKIYISIGIIFYFYLFAKQLIVFNNISQLLPQVFKYTLGWPYYIIKIKDILK